MKNPAIVSIPLMFALIGMASAQDKPLKPGKVIQRIAVVPANKAWTAAGITIGPRDRVTIKASGTIRFHSGDKQSEVDANGWGVGNYQEDWADDCNACDDPILNANHAALIVDVNGDKFFVGKDAVFSGKNGLLYLGINDCTLTGEFYNSGQFGVAFKVEKDAEPPIELEADPALEK
jgi:hypothetical protein